MDIEYDLNKHERNCLDRGISFELAREFDFDTAEVKLDTRQINEQRFIAIGLIKKELYTLVFTPRGKIMRVISLRKASKKERIKWQTNQTLI